MRYRSQVAKEDTHFRLVRFWARGLDFLDKFNQAFVITRWQLAQIYF